MSFFVENSFDAFKRGYCACFVMLLFALFSDPAIGGDDVYVKVSPETVIAGEPAELQLVSTTAFPALEKTPSIPHLRWSKEPPTKSRQTSIYNTRRITIFKTIYLFTVNSECLVTLPAMNVKLGHLMKKSESLKFNVVKRKLLDASGNKIPIDDILYSSAMLLTKNKEVYVGQEIPFEVRVYSLQGLQISYAWPQIDAENIVMKDFSSVNPASSYFKKSALRTVKLKGQLYAVRIFRGALRPISPGLLSGKIVVPCVIKVQSSRRKQRTGDPFDDLFNGGMFNSGYRNIQYKLIAKFDDRKVYSLPPLPTDSRFLGLVGDWDVSYSLNIKTLKAGEPVTLTVSIVGDGTLDTLTAPEIKIRDFLVYPPEVKKEPFFMNDRGKATIRYAIIPKRQGEISIDLAFSTFQPSSGIYVKRSFTRSFKVAESDKPSAFIVDDAGGNNASSYSHEKAAAKTSVGILYLKKKASGALSLPLWRNNAVLIIFLFLLGPLVLVFSELLAYRRIKLSCDPLLKRKADGKRRKGKVLARLNAASENDLHEIIRNDLAPLVNDLCGFPPGTSIDELAEKVENPDIAESLRIGSSSSYMPGSGAPQASKELTRKLVKALKTLSVMLIAAAPFLHLSAADVQKKNSTGKILSDPLALYDNAAPEQARKFYEQRLDPVNPDSAWLYNMGNCDVKSGNLPMAIVCFERARRLNPSDSDILENLNYVRRKLLLPQIGVSLTPLDALINFRDSFRPDQWIVAIAAFWSLAWLILAFRRRLSNRKWGSFLGVSIIAASLCVAAYVSQKHSTYNSNKAIVIKNDVPVYLLPSTVSDKAEFVMRPGEEVTIEETRHDWLRVREQSAEGWVKSDVVERLWPYE